MDRCALFVDAGYVLADGAMAVHGTRRRESVSWDYAGLLQLLGTMAAERTRLPLLRSYWYEATAEGRRTAEHDTLADLPGVKVRMARIRPGRGQSIEGEMHRDLTALARHRAVSDVMVVSAEEDLTEVISDVQDMGMRVTLLHLAGDGEQTISRALRQECDDVCEISAAHLRPYVELISGAEPPRPDESEEKQAAPRPAMNGNVNGNVNGNGRAPAATRPDRTVRPAPQPAAPAPQADQGRPDQAEPPAAAEHAPVPDFAASVSYGASVDYGSVPDYSTPDYSRSAPDYSMPTQDYSQPASVPENIYPAPVAVPAPVDDGPGYRNGLAARPAPGADPAAYNPGAVREQYQRDGLPRETDAGDAGDRDRDRLQPVPAAGSGSAQIRRLPTRGTGPAGPNGQPPLGLPPAPLPPAPASPVAASAASAPASGTPAAETSIGQYPPVQLAGPQRPGVQLPAAPPANGQPAPAQPAGAQVTGAHPVVPVAPVVPMEPQNGMAYLGAHSAAPGAPRPAAQGPAAPQHPGGQQGGQQGHGGQSGPLGLVGPAGSVAQANGVGPAGAPGDYPVGTPGVSLADAVQSAHEEGQAFGESVARDAPALWLEAVLARKPRMPSDLEARLLQGSALPIDFLLHDEVRHALRRGFWDALERARR